MLRTCFKLEKTLGSTQAYGRPVEFQLEMSKEIENDHILLAKKPI